MFGITPQRYCPSFYIDCVYFNGDDISVGQFISKDTIVHRDYYIDDANENETKRDRFHDAFKIAEREKIQIAYSNEAFELWLLLHITGVEESKPLSRHEIYAKLQTQIRKSAEKYNVCWADNSSATDTNTENFPGKTHLAVTKNVNKWMNGEFLS